MAICGGRELPTLKITFEELQKRSEQLSRESCSSPDSSSNWDMENSRSGGDSTEHVSTRGLLYLPPSTDLGSTSRKEKRTKGKTRNDRSTHSVHSGGTTTHSKGQGERRTKSRLYDESAISRSDPDKLTPTSEADNLKGEWKRHESKKIERALSRWSGDVTQLSSVFQACDRMEECAEKVLLKDMEVFSELDITTKLWRTGHYPIVGALRSRVSHDSGVKDTLEKFLSSSMEFYSKLPSIVESQLSFKVSELVHNGVQCSSKTHWRKVMMAVSMCHNWYIYLGDLSRYQQQSLPSNGVNWSKPRRFYLQAQQLAPKSGKPYNQLAIISINTHRRLDAVYYYMRSLATKPAFQSAYDSLVGIFADTSKKAEKLEQDERKIKKKKEAEDAKKLKKAERLRNKRSRHHQKQMEKNSRSLEFSSGKREIWIMPGATNTEGGVQSKSHDASHDVSHDGTPVDAVSDLMSKMSILPIPQVVIRKMTSAFILVHAKIFTRTGVETLADTVKKTLHYCRNMCEGLELGQPHARTLLKMMVINIFSIHHAAESCGEDHNAVVYYCGAGLDFMLQFSTVLLEACVLRLQTASEAGDGTDMPLPHDDVSPPLERWVGPAGWEKLLDYLSVVVPAVRMVFEWFKCQRELCVEAIASVKQPTLRNFWFTAANFLNLSSELALPHTPPCSPGHSQDATPPDTPKLWEDRALAGFLHLRTSLSTKDTFAILDLKRMTRKQRQEHCVARVAVIADICQHLCRQEEGTITSGPGFSLNCHSKRFTLQETTPRDGGVEVGVAPQIGGVEVGVALLDAGRLEELQEDLNESFDVEESSVSTMSYGFSDSDDDVIEVLSDEEEGEETGMEPEVMEGSEVEEDNRPSVTSEEDSEIERLKMQRDGLVKQMKEKSQAKAMAENLLSEAAIRASREMVVTPRYLIPDTNCFVDMLPAIKSLVQRAEFTVAVPLTVLNELEGLSKGSETSLAVSAKHNLAKVTDGAKNALEYVTAAFHDKVPHLKVLTAQGSLLSTLTFRVQVTGKASNDDLILESCLQLHAKTKFTTSSDADDTRHKVVMLTGDRNLRVKAHANDLPVKDIPGFMKLLT